MKKTYNSKKKTLWFIIGLIIAAFFWFMFSEGVDDARENEDVKTESIISE